MSETKYTSDHEWLRREGDGSLTIGITDYAQEQLGDVVYVELPEVGASIAAGENLVVIESVKAVGEINMPIAGTVQAVNDTLAEQPELLNSDPLDSGWIVRIEAGDDAGLDGFMDEQSYRDFVAGLQ